MIPFSTGIMHLAYSCLQCSAYGLGPVDRRMICSSIFVCMRCYALLPYCSCAACSRLVCLQWRCSCTSVIPRRIRVAFPSPFSCPCSYDFGSLKEVRHQQSKIFRRALFTLLTGMLGFSQQLSYAHTFTLFIITTLKRSSSNHVRERAGSICHSGGYSGQPSILQQI